MLGNTAEAAQTATLRPILDGALRLFGENPGSTLRVMPDLWRLSYRGVLDVRIERVDEREARIKGCRVCAELLASAAAQQVLVVQTEGAMAVTRTMARLIRSSWTSIDARSCCGSCGDYGSKCSKSQ